MWSGSSPIQITLPIEFNATNDAIEDVMKPIVRLLMLASPKVAPGGRFIPPGPTISNIVAFLTRLLDEIPNDAPLGIPTARDWVKNAVKSNITPGENVSVFVGDFFYLDNVVITGVQPHFHPIMDIRGLPMKASCTVTFESYLTPTRGEIQRYFMNRVKVKD